MRCILNNKNFERATCKICSQGTQVCLWELHKETEKLRKVITAIYWRTTCTMTQEYLKNNTDIDFKKALKET